MSSTIAGRAPADASRHTAAELAALLIVCVWGVNFVFMKAMYREFDVAAYLCLRYSGMLLLGWLVALLGVHRAPDGRTGLRIAPADRLRLLIAGVCGFSLYIPLSAVGLSYTSAFATALLIAVAPLFMALLLWLLRQEPISGRQLLALAVAFAGVLLFVAAGAAASVHAGDLLSLFSAFFFAAYTVTNRPLVSRYRLTVLTTWTLTAGGLPVIVATLPGLWAQDWSRTDWAGWTGLIWAIVVPVYAAWAVWGWVNGQIGVGRSSLFMFLVPVVGGVAARALLGEGFGPQRLLGAGIVFAGLALGRGRRGATDAPAPVARAVETAGEAAG